MEQSSGFLGQLEPSLRREIEPRIRTVRVLKGRAVVEHGSASSDVYLVMEGELKVMLYSPKGDEISITTIGSGDLFGELTAIDGTSRAATVVAVSTSLLRIMSRSDFRRCLEASPKASLWIAKRLSRQLRALNNRLFELATLNVRNRLHFELLRLALLAGVQDCRTTIAPSPTHSEIAARLGTHREAITREMRDLAKSGILRQDGRRLEILDLNALSSIVQQLSGQVAGIYMAPHTAPK
jgi:CRP/FNR family transcriptional regulator, cyclic AMP receptor protein